MTPSEMDGLIYSIYPRKIARIDAMKAIAKAAKQLAKQNGTDETEARRWLYKACATYAKSPAGQNPDRTLIPHPATWFNRGSYLDDPQEWQTSRAKFEPGVRKPVSSAGLDEVNQLRKKMGLVPLESL